MGVKGCAGDLKQLERDHLRTDTRYTLLSQVDQDKKKALFSDR